MHQYLTGKYHFSRLIRIILTSSFAGYGQEFGGIEIVINSDHDVPVMADFLHSLPWYIRVYMHDLQIKVNGKPKDRAG